MSSDCLFCGIVRGEIPSTVVAETADAIAIRDIAAKAPVHVLVLPRAHVRSLDEASDPALLGNLLALAAQVARDENIASSGYRTVINTGANGGQTVDHLHVHVLGGRHLTWPPG